MNKQRQKGLWQAAILKQVVLALLVGGSLTLGLFYLCAVLVVARSIPQSYFLVIATIAFCVGCAISSMVLAFQRKEGGLICGLGCFAVFAGAILLCGWLGGARMLSAITCVQLAAFCASACVGGALGVNKAEKRARRRRKG